jgi:general secretion pathway protein C
MERILKRYFYLVPIAVILLCGVLAAAAANQVIEARFLLGAPTANGAARHKKVEPHKPPPSKDATEVINRNIFCSTCEPPKPETASPSAPVDDNHPPATTLPLALQATIVVEKHPSLSSATITNTSSFRSGSYRVGELIPDAGEVKRIRAKWVDFHNKQSNRMERIEIGPPQGAPAVASVAPMPAVPPPSPASGSPSPEGDLLAAVDQGVKKVSDNAYDIDRGLVDKILTDPSVVARQARIVPSIKDGKANGFKMYAIRPNSVFAKIGLQNGDTIQSINGFDMSSPDKALEVYTKVRSASNLSVSILRRGQPLQMDYSIK